MVAKLAELAQWDQLHQLAKWAQNTPNQSLYAMRNSIVNLSYAQVTISHPQVSQCHPKVTLSHQKVTLS